MPFADPAGVVFFLLQKHIRSVCLSVLPSSLIGCVVTLGFFNLNFTVFSVNPYKGFPFLLLLLLVFIIIFIVLGGLLVFIVIVSEHIHSNLCQVEE